MAMCCRARQWPIGNLRAYPCFHSTAKCPPERRRDAFQCDVAQVCPPTSGCHFSMPHIPLTKPAKDRQSPHSCLTKGATWFKRLDVKTKTTLVSFACWVLGQQLLGPKANLVHVLLAEDSDLGNVHPPNALDLVSCNLSERQMNAKLLKEKKHAKRQAPSSWLRWHEPPCRLRSAGTSPPQGPRSTSWSWTRRQPWAQKGLCHHSRFNQDMLPSGFYQPNIHDNMARSRYCLPISFCFFSCNTFWTWDLDWKRFFSML